MKLSELLSPWIASLDVDTDIVGMHNDSRKIKPGFLFIAYKGAAADGRLFARQAIENGASAMLYESQNLPESFKPSSELLCIPFQNVASNLGQLASRFYGYPTKEMEVTGITGTNGKTTIAYLLMQAYELLGEKSAYIGTLGYGNTKQIVPLANTTPDALCLQALMHEYRQQGVGKLCMEVSSHALDQNRVDGIDFRQAIFTNLSHEHLDYHGSIEAYAAAKATLFAKPGLKAAIINADDAYAKQMLRQLSSDSTAICYGFKAGADVRAEEHEQSIEGSSFKIISPWGSALVKIRALGLFNIYNALAVFSSLMAEGYPFALVIAALEKLKAAPGRMELVSTKPCVLVDYAHTPDALENALSALNQLKPRKLIVVFGCGGDRDKEKRPMMGQIASRLADYVMVTSDNPRTEDPNQIMQEIAQGIPQAGLVEYIVDREEAIRKALSIADETDIILIAGKGHESYQEVGKERLYFSDQELVRSLLAQ